ncbi:MAG: zinc dependent phospholipase C family protein [Chloroflexi bacterium]|nr:zinc dependent phospholipase C family protein [Chloroflexota bacterium]
MPTPFYHLSLAKTLLEGADLHPAAHDLLQRERSAFLLGNTAPDVQTISGQPRQATHFFDLPLRLNDRPAWEQCLLEFPALAQAATLKQAQAAFVAGYLCHLQADWYWVVEIFVPVFGLRAAWETFPRRLYLHNVLRSYLDRDILPQLNNGIPSGLAAAEPENWLPFVADGDLRRWRDFLAGQLQPEARVQTVEVFAARQGIPPEDYYRLIESEDAMQREVFSRLPRRMLNDYRQRLLTASSRLLNEYLIRDMSEIRG